MDADKFKTLVTVKSLQISQTESKKRCQKYRDSRQNAVRSEQFVLLHESRHCQLPITQLHICQTCTGNLYTHKFKIFLSCAYYIKLHYTKVNSTLLIILAALFICTNYRKTYG